MNISIFINKIRWISYSVAANLDNQSLFFPKSLVLLYALAIVDTMQKQKELLCQRDSQSFLYFTKLPFSEIVFVSFLNKNSPFYPLLGLLSFFFCICLFAGKKMRFFVIIPLFCRENLISCKKQSKRNANSNKNPSQKRSIFLCEFAVNSVTVFCCVWFQSLSIFKIFALFCTFAQISTMPFMLVL